MTASVAFGPETVTEIPEKDGRQWMFKVVLPDDRIVQVLMSNQELDALTDDLHRAKGGKP